MAPLSKFWRLVSPTVLYRLPVILYCCLIYWQSAHFSTNSDPLFPHDDKVMHLLCYAILAVLIYRAFMGGTWYRLTSKKLGILSGVLSFGYGISDELHQSFVPARTASISDAVADLTGAAAGITLLFWFIRIRSNRA
ncbi:MAG: VanZ family protein [Desulfobacteraceae bacterium]|nr:MAG: VanZ family protein [Desulfobacteraceae bacterium]